MKLATVVVLFAVCAAAQVQPSPGPASAAPAAKAAISGKVVNAVTGEPLKKASVMLASAGRGAQARSAITDDQGAFSFAALEPGAYRLLAMRNGFVRQGYGERDPGSYLTMPSAVNVKPGQELKDVLIRLQPAAAITGHVVDQDGEPLMQVHVQALRWNYSRGRRQLMPAGADQTNDRGEYRIYNLTPGRYYLSVTYEGGYLAGYMAGIGIEAVDEVYVPTFYPGVSDPAQAAPVELRGGDDLPGINFMIAPQRAVTVSGRVFNAVTGQPGRNVHVSVMARTFTMRAFLSGDHDAMTDEQGAFHLRGVGPGSYIVAAEWDAEGTGPGTIITSSGNQSTTQYGRRHYSARQNIEVGGADVEAVNLVLAPGTDVAGTVKIEGTLANSSPSPVEPSETVVMGTRVIRGSTSSPLRVMLEALDDVSLGNIAVAVKPDNTFVLPNVPEGAYRVVVNGGPDGVYLKSARLGGQDVLEDGFLMTRGRRGALDLVVSSLTGRVEGTALDSSDKPFAGARVVLVPEGSRRKLPNLFRTVVSDQYGHFLLRSVPPGDYKLFAWDVIESGAYQDPEFLRAFEDRGQSVRIAESSQSTAEIKVIITEERGAQ